MTAISNHFSVTVPKAFGLFNILMYLHFYEVFNLQFQLSISKELKVLKVLKVLKGHSPGLLLRDFIPSIFNKEVKILKVILCTANNFHLRVPKKDLAKLHFLYQLYISKTELLCSVWNYDIL
jgi:hypothetical protein